MIKAVLFDMDGVLVDSFEAWFSVFNSALKYFGLKSVTKQEFIKKCWSKDSAVVVPKYFPDIRINAVAKYYFKHFLEFKHRIKVLPESKSVLQELRSKGIKTAIVTNTYHKQTEMMLKAISLFRFFDAVVSADDVKLGKPEPDMLFKACKKLGVRKEDAVFVGDTNLDMTAGRNAGMFTVGFNVGGGDKRIKNLKEILLLKEIKNYQYENNQYGKNH